MILGIMPFGAMHAAPDSVCNDFKDTQSISFPAILPALLPVFIMVPVLREQQNFIATLLSLPPPCVPLLVLVRMSMPEGVPGWQPWVGTGLLFVASLLSVWLSARVFRVGILSQGTPPSRGRCSCGR